MTRGAACLVLRRKVHRRKRLGNLLARAAGAYGMAARAIETSLRVPRVAEIDPVRGGILRCPNKPSQLMTHIARRHRHRL